MSWGEAALRWYAVLVVVTWGLAPFVRFLCPRLADRGMLLARPICLLAVVYPTWLLASLRVLPYSDAGLWVTLGVGAAIGWGVAWRRRLIEGRWLRALAVAELVSAATFSAYLWLRGFTPEILNTEKPMDAAMLAAGTLTASMPPPDPWFAGEPINYYYLGYLLHGAVARLADVVPTTGFNLALATVISMAATAAAGVGYDAVRPGMSRGRAAVAGLVAALLLVLVGNLYAALRLARTPAETLAAGWWEKEFGVGWRASRIVCDGVRVGNDCSAPAVETINEFPFFSFLLGDLHPHVMALPFTVVALGLALALAPRRVIGPPIREERARLLASGAVVGALYALNSWDLPTFFVVVAAAAWVGGGGGLAWSGSAARRVGLLAAGAVVPWLPFVLGFVPPAAGGGELLPAALRDLPVVPALAAAVVIHGGERTSAGEYLTIFGVPYLFALWLIATGFAQDRGGGGHAAGGGGMRPAGVGAGVAALAAAVLLPAPVLVLCGAPLVAALAQMGRRPAVSARSLATGLFALGFALSIVVELVFLRDLFGNRMNTLFKVYYQVWTLFAVATAVAMLVIWREARPRWAARPILAVLGAAAIAAGLVYPVVASAHWTDRFTGWDGLDGIAYVERLDADEAAAIRWLQARAAPGEVLLEAVGCSYRPNSDIPTARFSAFTGMPTVLGWWQSHETLWRGGQAGGLAEIARRREDVERLFAAPSGLLRERYGIRWLVVGRYEAERWPGTCDESGPYEGIDAAGFPGEGWELAFSSGDVRVFRWVGAGGGAG